MPDNSFDVVSKVDLQEVSNAIQQALKEIHTRFDLKDSKSNIELEKDSIVLHSADEYKLKAVLETVARVAAIAASMRAPTDSPQRQSGSAAAIALARKSSTVMPWPSAWMWTLPGLSARNSASHAATKASCNASGETRMAMALPTSSNHHTDFPDVATAISAP